MQLASLIDGLQNLFRLSQNKIQARIQLSIQIQLESYENTDANTDENTDTIPFVLVRIWISVSHSSVMLSHAGVESGFFDVI